MKRVNPPRLIVSSFTSTSLWLCLGFFLVGESFSTKFQLRAAEDSAERRTVVINEIHASGQSDYSDEDGESNDWIELRNLSDVVVNLTGWSLTDDQANPTKWVVPSVEIQPDGYLLIFASGKNRRNPTAALHTNFRLNANGEYVGLFSKGPAKRVADEVFPQYPKQRFGISFGLIESGERVHFLAPTPGKKNAHHGMTTALARPGVSVERGFFEEPITVLLSSSVANATVRYTTDHSTPTATNGRTYREPITISESTVLRAVAVASNALTSEVATHSYFFGLSDTKKSLPVLSVVTDESNLQGDTGIMESQPRNTNKRGIEWERPVSAELMMPGFPNDGFQLDCGLRVHGGMAIRERYEPNGRGTVGKYSFRLYFRGGYGTGNLDYPLFSRHPLEKYDRIVLRAGMNDPYNPFIVDELVRRLHHDMGGPASQGTMVNLFLNGQYKGYYNPVECIDIEFLRSRHGGGKDWDLIAQFGETQEGDRAEWDRLQQTVVDRDLSRPENYAEAVGQINIDSFIDYILLNIYAAMDDWPDNNWRAARERVETGQWRFYVWDAERAFGNGIEHFHGADPLTWNIHTSRALAGDSVIARLVRSLLENQEFRLRFANRAQMHFSNDGALTDENISRRHTELVRDVKGVIPNMDPFIEREWIPKRREIVIDQLAGMGLRFSDPPD